MPAVNEFHEAARLLAAGDARAAAGRLRAILAAAGPTSPATAGRPAAGPARTGGLPPAFEADVRYLLGRALGECGDRDGRAVEWRHVLVLDAEAPRRPALLTPDEFEAIAAAALDELPQALLDELTGVAVMLDDRPSPAMVADGLDPRILGLYHGVPLNRRSASFGAPYADTIHLFSANLERACATRDQLTAQIRVTVLHETAHFFGYSEGQLRSMGLA
jgi:predicted Zn-dependent protease with MMP-like domain